MSARGKRGSIALLVAAETLAMTVWFAAAAALPTLRGNYAFEGWHEALLTSCVQAGFVVGTLASAALGLADRIDPRRLFSLSAFAAALATLAIVALPPTSLLVVALRFMTGMCMAGVYPVGMKLAASWARGDTGLLIGILVGAVTFGSASPHLIAAFGGLDWRVIYLAGALCAVAAGIVVRFVAVGPDIGPAPPLTPAAALEAWKNKPLRLANLGYFGHMWELYAMWAWIGLFLHDSFVLSMPPNDALFWSRLATFATIGVGAAGCLFGGLFADRLGRTTLTIAAMTVSGACAVVAGLLFGAAPWLLVALCLVWGVSIVADSAQFSASVVELSDRSLTGTMLTVQTCIGFLLTLATIHVMPYAIAALGWNWAFAILAVGPALGVWAMARLRAHPDARRLAGGRG